jgi:TonB family protein
LENDFRLIGGSMRAAIAPCPGANGWRCLAQLKAQMLDGGTVPNAFNVRAIFKFKPDRLYRVYVDDSHLTFVRIGGQSYGLVFALETQLGAIGRYLARSIRAGEDEKAARASLEADAFGPTAHLQGHRHNFQIPLGSISSATIRKPKSLAHGFALALWTISYVPTGPERFQFESGPDLDRALTSLPGALGSRLVLEPLPGTAHDYSRSPKIPGRKIPAWAAVTTAVAVVFAVAFAAGFLQGVGDRESLQPMPPVPAGLSDASANGRARPGLKPLVRVEPDYPAEAARSGIQGWVALEFMASKQGRVEDPRVIASAPEGYFEAAALEAVGKWTYEPEKFDGATVPSPGIRVLIRFALQ